VQLDKIRNAPQLDGAGSACAVALICAATFALARNHPNLDVAWLIDASGRWLRGAILYRDIVEVNPPLVFYETVGLSAGSPSPNAYAFGVCVAMALSGLWILRLRGPYAAVAATFAMAIAGIHNFGQRDTLALIFGLPMLMRRRVGAAEGVALALWAFLGFGLKPYLLCIPVADAIARAWLARSPKPLFSAPYIVLGLSCVAYAGAVAVLYPLYLSHMVPLGRFVYWLYGVPLSGRSIVLSALIAFVSAIAVIDRRAELVPLAAAALGALASFYLQGRYWSYHFAPALGVALVMTLIEARRSRPFASIAALLCASQLFSGSGSSPSAPIPPGVRTVAILSSQVSAAYPAVVERGIVNDTRYPALWVLPGAWSIANDPKRSAADRAKARSLLAEQRSTIRGDILRERPQLVMIDTTLANFDRMFRMVDFVGPLPGYADAGRSGSFVLLARRGADAPPRAGR